MGKKKAQKKAKTKAKKQARKKLQKTASKVDSWIADAGLTEGELMLAGLGVMARAVDKKQKKMLKKAVKTGRKVMNVGLESLSTSKAGAEPHGEDESAESSEAPPEPVIAYRAKGGGWYAIEVDGVEVDSAQGESDAATRAGELLQNYAALDDGAPSETGVHHVGGGWYMIVVKGVPVNRIRGKESAHERFAELGIGVGDQAA